ncbi:hypothetical protein H6S82_03710 [Planktothrix sp. FACHB-1355]|uniref:Uncharacterized protein n=1 Tax=Aerosakkonema funiforme FACHB-1375 TaxID=2949571 RepID=A0A926ZE36_9CYAN|nr:MULTISPECIES: hypothetical protein [Oscillatoriales]MBD2179648.1 hypothetical protein [Aerosakkonema funiforme FACHB-1375]MBD3557963.1 hypothetical protein [Planktothrix sp. FACHB-1355]
MNAKLVETLAQIIETLSKEERTLLEEKLKKPDRREVMKQIEEHRAEISARRGGKPISPPVEDIIHQMREERTEQIMSASFPQFYPEET